MKYLQCEVQSGDRKFWAEFRTDTDAENCMWWKRLFCDTIMLMTEVPEKARLTGKFRKAYDTDIFSATDTHTFYTEVNEAERYLIINFWKAFKKQYGRYAV